MAASTKITYPDPLKARVMKQGWGKSLSIPFGDAGIHGIIVVNYNSVAGVYHVIVAGEWGKLTLSKWLINGTDCINMAYSNTSNIMTLSTKSGNNATITYIGS